MKQLVSLLIKLGILGAIVFAAVATNPKEPKHKRMIEAKQASLEKKDILGQTDRMLYGDTGANGGAAPYTYHNYFVCSKVTGPKGEMASFGFFNKVFVTKSEL
jgi:hypothetical protein